MNGVSRLMSRWTALFAGILLASTFGVQAQNIVINEIMASNDTAFQDEDGEYGDWIEIYNPGTSTVSLLDWGLTDDEADPFQWSFGNVDIAPGEFLLIWADKKDMNAVTNGNQLHTNFKISGSGEEVVLTRPDTSTADYFEPTPVETDSSLGRKPDGTGPLYYFSTSTPGAANTTTGVSAYTVHINEVMASNDTAHQDEDGEFGDWIELYNSSTLNVNLNGWGLTDDAGDLFQWTFGDVTIAPGEFLVVWADKKDMNAVTNGNQLHTNFKISGDGEDIVLTRPDLSTADQYAATPIATDTSYGRLPDGTGPLTHFSIYTPGAANSSTGGIAEEVFINEVQSSNDTTVQDEDGDFGDWIELYNASDIPVNLSGWGLSDSSLLPFQWTFGDITIAPGEYLLVWADDKDINTVTNVGDALHANFKISSGGEEVVLTRPDASTADEFGPAPIATDTSLGRKPDGTGPLYFFAAPTPGAANSTVGENADTIHINEVMSSNDFAHQDEDGEYGDWIELYNSGALTVNLLGWGLTDDTSDSFKWVFGDVEIAPGEFLVVWADNKDINVITNVGGALHTNFKISGGGEDVVLTRPDSSIADAYEPTAIETDTSMGRKPDGTGPLHFFAVATPGAANTTAGVIAKVPAPEFSLESGIYTNDQVVEITTDVPDAVIRYTLDGSDPTTNSPVYTGPITVTERSPTANLSLIPTNEDPNPGPPYYEGWQPPVGDVFRFRTVRASLFVEGAAPGKIESRSYVITRDGTSRYSLPIISINSDPDNYFDPEIGIYVEGNHRNFFQKGSAWERPGTIEMIGTDGKLAFRKGVGIRLHGTSTVSRPRKSQRIYMREGTVEYKIFPDKETSGYDTLMLRGGGNDWGNTVFRDVFTQSLISHIPFDKQHTRQFIVFVNGEYWGIHNGRDRYDEGYIKNHYGFGEEEYIQMEADLKVSKQLVYDRGNEGMAADFFDLYDFLNVQGVASQGNYDQVKERIDVTNFIDYISTEVLCGNTDWPANNIKLWRSVQTNSAPDAPFGHDAKWRWMIYDTDLGFGADFEYVVGRDEFADFNMFEFLTDPNPDHAGNHTNSTLFFRRLIENDEFKTSFITRFSDHLNSAFLADRMIQQHEKLAAIYAPEMEEHVRRWRQPVDWASDLQRVRDYAALRPAAVWRHLQDFFGLGDREQITVNVSSASAGTIKVNTIDVDSDLPGVSESVYPWTGEYFSGMTVRLTAKEKRGYNFVKWVDGDTGAELSTDEVYSFVHSEAGNYLAVFELDLSVLVPQPHNLSSGAFTFDEWSDAEAAGTYPANMTFEQTDKKDPGLDVELNGLWTLGYANTNKSRINGLGPDGVAFINTGSTSPEPGSGYLGSALVALSTLGRENVEVSFAAGTVLPNFRVYALRLQYRVGAEGPFIDVLDGANQPIEYIRNETAGHAQAFGPVALPDTVNNQPYVQVRWKYHYVDSGVSGARSKLRIDDIVITSDVLKTKSYPQVYFRGTPNGWGASAMELVSNNIWEIQTAFGADSSNERFKFDVYGDWTLNFGEINYDDIADQDGGDIYVIHGEGNYIVRFNDLTKRYWIIKYIPNQPPVADADVDFTVSPDGGQPQLNGGSSYDPDGTIVSYDWTQIAGSSVTIEYPYPEFPKVTIPAGPVGTEFVFELVVTDNDGASATDTVAITRAYISSEPVVYFRGTPNGWGTTQMTLVSNYTWEISATFGPAADERFKFSVSSDWSRYFGDNNQDGYMELDGADVPITEGEGDYVIRYNDQTRQYWVSKVFINTPPVADAGYDRRVSLAGGLELLNGSESYDPDVPGVGNGISYQWSQYSGPSITINDTNVPVTGIHFPATTAGAEYVLQLLVIDQHGATDVDTVTITQENFLPHAMIGQVSNVYLEGGDVNLDGSGSFDEDGTITSYGWTQLSGPSVGISFFSAATAVAHIPPATSTTLRVFELSVVDDMGAASTASVLIVQKPIELLKTFEQVNFRGTPNGWGITPMTLVSNYTWEIDATFGSRSDERFKFDIFGDWTMNFGETNADFIADRSGEDISIISGAGDYTIRFNDLTKEYWILRNGSNLPPVANGGGPREVSTDGDVITLNGGASYDTDGYIASFDWDVWYYPVGASFSISNASSAFPVLTIPAATEDSLYIVRLTVTDDDGAMSSTNIHIVQKFESEYPTVYFRGTPNGWGAQLMTLVSNNIWETEAVFGPGSNERFKLDVYADWSHNFGDNNTDYIADRSGGNIRIKQGSGTYRIRFNDLTKEYWVYKDGAGYVSEYTSMTVAGTFNSWNPSANNMVLVNNNTWQYDVVLFAPINFKFVADGSWSVQNWGDGNPPGTTVPISAIADVGRGNIKISSALSGAYRILFNDITFAYSMEEVPPPPSGGAVESAAYTTPWEKLYGINLLNIAQHNLDPDVDGLKNLSEYYQDTNPHTADTDGDGVSDRDELLAGTDPRLVGEFLSADLRVGTDSGSYTVEWDGRESRIYAVEYTTDIAVGVWSVVSGHESISGVTAAMTADVTDAINRGAVGFRVRVVHVEFLP